MKLEPVKKSRIPKYAVLIAAAASVVLMTGCQADGEMAIEGTAPDPATYGETVPQNSEVLPDD